MESSLSSEDAAASFSNAAFLLSNERLLPVPASMSSNSVGFLGVGTVALPLDLVLAGADCEGPGSGVGERRRLRGRKGGMVIHVNYVMVRRCEVVYCGGVDVA